ncbi:MAG TPA: hypothetical protein VHV51_02610, partial [Polyangiaceae bacterium]|nr:hypothetical protein [Polyangiaceae bacterium]
LGLLACRSQTPEPAPPPATYELVVAAPGARGARAAGTDAAPPAPSELGAAAPEDGEDSDEDDADAGAEPDAGTVAPLAEPEAGVPL